MVSKKPQPAIWNWKVKSPRPGNELEGELVAYWEVYYDPISDNYTPQEISAEELFNLWVGKVKQEYHSGLIPIHWSVESAPNGTFEFMPFRFESAPLDQVDQDFLTYFTWPVSKETGERLNWLHLPVVDKLWNTKRADKGGFIQEFTGWKPGILQPHVYLPSLLQSRETA